MAAGIRMVDRPNLGPNPAAPPATAAAVAVVTAAADDDDPLDASQDDMGLWRRGAAGGRTRSMAEPKAAAAGQTKTRTTSIDVTSSPPPRTAKMEDRTDCIFLIAGIGVVAAVLLFVMMDQTRRGEKGAAMLLATAGPLLIVFACVAVGFPTVMLAATMLPQWVCCWLVRREQDDDDPLSVEESSSSSGSSPSSSSSSEASSSEDDSETESDPSTDEDDDAGGVSGGGGEAKARVSAQKLD